MDTPEIAHIIAQLRLYNPQKIILFGSYAYGNPGVDSDLDIAIVKKTNKPFYKRLREVRMLLRTATPVDIFVFTPEEFERGKTSNPLIEEIASRGKVVYG